MARMYPLLVTVMAARVAPFSSGADGQHALIKPISSPIARLVTEVSHSIIYVPCGGGSCVVVLLQTRKFIYLMNYGQPLWSSIVFSDW